MEIIDVDFDVILAQKSIAFVVRINRDISA